VPNVRRSIIVKVASEPAEFEEAYKLVAASYRASGYEMPSSKLIRFTPYHALSATTTYVAKHDGRILATFSLVPDNILLGLPMEAIYAEEIAALRQTGARLAEVTSFAATDLSLREFNTVFRALIRLMKQHHVHHGGDTWVITVNPKHRNFYTKVLGYVLLGPCRPYPKVLGAPAEAYVLDLDGMRIRAPKTYQQMFGTPLPAEAFLVPRLPANWIRYFVTESSQTDDETLEMVLGYVERVGSPRSWKDAMPRRPTAHQQLDQVGGQADQPARQREREVLVGTGQRGGAATACRPTQ
jgi:hypothetical protein